MVSLLVYHSQPIHHYRICSNLCRLCCKDVVTSDHLYFRLHSCSFTIKGQSCFHTAHALKHVYRRETGRKIACWYRTLHVLSMPAGKESPRKGREGGARQGSKSSKETMKGRQKPAQNALAQRGQSQSCHQCRQSIHSSKGVSEVKSGKERLRCSTCTRFW